MIYETEKQFEGLERRFSKKEIYEIGKKSNLTELKLYHIIDSIDAMKKESAAETEI
jgi:hypothetical protein